MHVQLILHHIATATATNVIDAKTSKQRKKGKKLLLHVAYNYI